MENQDSEIEFSEVELSVSPSSSQAFSPPSSPVPKRMKRLMWRQAVSENFAAIPESSVSVHSQSQDLPQDTLPASPINLDTPLAHRRDESSSAESSDDDNLVGSDHDSSMGSLSASYNSEVLSSNVSECDINESLSDEPELLFPGSLKSKDEAILELLCLYFENKWTKASLQSTLTLFNTFLPENHKMPSSLHLLLKYVEGLGPRVEEKEHFYCADCLLHVDSMFSICTKCGKSNISKFFEIPVASLLKFYLEKSDLVEVLDKYPHVSADGYISDIQDGEEFKKIKLKCSGPYHLTLLWNTDGIQLSKSSNVCLWPIQAEICEVPHSFKKKFTLFCGIWVDKCEPNMQLFLKPFCNSLISLFENGLEWTHPATSETIISKVVAPVLSADAPAKAKVLSQQLFSAKYGCNTCEQKASQVDPGDGKPKMRRFVYRDTPATLRTAERIGKQAQRAERSGCPKRGIKRKSIVSGIPLFDTGSSAVTDYMHCVLLGCVFRFIQLWFFVKGPWYVNQENRKNVDNFLAQDVRVPDFITRLPRSVMQYKLWKANELRAWLLFYSLPAMRLAKMPQCYIDHFSLLVSATFIMLKGKISPADLDLAEKQICMFVRDVGKLYRYKDYTYNMHNLLHLPLWVKRWGPLFATSAFRFEDSNGILAHLIHGTKHVGRELVNNLRICRGFRVLSSMVQLSKNSFQQAAAIVILGAMSLNNLLSDDESSVLERAGVTNFKIFKRIKVNGAIFTSELYDKSVKRANSFVLYDYEGTTRCGEIVHFIRTADEEVLCLMRPLKTDHALMFFQSYRNEFHKLTHIIPFTPQNNLIIVELKYVQEKLVKVGSYLCRRPNHFEMNL